VLARNKFESLPHILSIKGLVAIFVDASYEGRPGHEKRFHWMRRMDCFGGIKV
jgi:hypothetical protein